MTSPSPSPAVLRGRQAGAPGLHWRLDGAGGPTDPLLLALHGYGMDEDFFAVLLQKLFPQPVHVLLPRGPKPGDMGLRVAHGASWYDYDGDQTRFRRELERVEHELLAFLAEVEAEQGLAPRARYLLGFSQGGYCGAWLAVRHPERFAGMIISGARVKTEFLEDAMPAAAARGFRALLCHGERDHSVTLEAAMRSRDGLAAGGIPAELRVFDAGHSLGRKQLAVIAEWLGLAIEDP